MSQENETIRSLDKKSDSIASAEHTKSKGAGLSAPAYGGKKSLNAGQFVGKMSQGLGTSLKNIKVVRNSKAAEAMGTDAFSNGNQIHFAKGKYNPNSESGQKVLGHEIVHSVQNAKGRVQSTGKAGGVKVNENNSLEHQANAETENIKNGRAASPDLRGANIQQGPAQAVQGWNLWGKIKKGAKSVGRAIGGAARSVGRGVSSAARSAGRFVKNGAQAIGGAARSVGRSIVSVGRTVGEKAVGAVRSAGRAVVNTGKRVVGAVKNVASRAAKQTRSIIQDIKRGGAAFGDMVQEGFGWIKGKVEQGMDAMQAAGAYVVDRIKKTSSKAWDGLKQMGSNALEGTKKVIEGIANSGRTAWNWLKGQGANIVDQAKTIWGRVKRMGASAWEGLKRAGSSIWSGIKDLGSSIWGKIKEIGSQLGNMIMGGIMSKLDQFLNKTAGILDSLLGPDGEKVGADEIPPQHVMDEFIAHNLAYKTVNEDGSISLSAAEISILENAGYDPNSIYGVTGQNGFQAVLVRPSENSSATPMLAFMGTNNFGGLMTDLDPKQVGDNQFKNNRHIIERLIRVAGGRVDVSGHSLGGAVAQITAANFTSSINRITTFQSPGISQDAVDMYNRNVENMGGEGPTAAHHIVKTDLVSKAGEENLPGSIYEHDLGVRDPLEAHTAYISATDDMREAREQYGITDEFVTNELGKDVVSDATIERFQEQPYPYRRKMVEFVRSGLGGARDKVVQLWNKLGNLLESGRRNIKSRVNRLIGRIVRRVARAAGRSVVSRVVNFFRNLTR